MMHAREMVGYFKDYGAQPPTIMTRTEIGDIVRQEFLYFNFYWNITHWRGLELVVDVCNSNIFFSVLVATPINRWASHVHFQSNLYLQ